MDPRRPCLSLLLLLTVACSTKTESPPPELAPTPATPEPVAEAPFPDLCAPLSGPAADRAKAEVATWPGAASMPEDANTSDCDFYTYAWQEFLHLTRTEDDRYSFQDWTNAEVIFGSATADPSSFHTRPMSKSSRGQVTADEFEQAAALVPVTAQNRRILHYAVQLDNIQRDFIRCCGLDDQACYNASADPAKLEPFAFGRTDAIVPSTFELPAGSVELKTAWQVVDADTPADIKASMLTVEGVVSPWFDAEAKQWKREPKPETLGLVGMHIVARTPAHPGWIWATFEHRRTAPDCGASEESGPWLLHDDSCEGAYCEDNSFCSACPLPLSEWKYDPEQVNPEDADCTKQLGKACAELSNEEFAQVQAKLAPAKLAELIETVRKEPSTVIETLPSGEEALVCTTDVNALHVLETPLFDIDRGCDKPPIPTQVCRAHVGEGQRIPQEIDALNDLVASALPDSLAANYRLVGVLWLDDAGEQQGAKGSSNVTMETFEQLTASGEEINCYVCHADQFNPNPYPHKPWAAGINDRSFVFMRLVEAGEAGVCKHEPSTCEARGWDPEAVCPQPQQPS